MPLFKVAGDTFITPNVLLLEWLEMSHCWQQPLNVSDGCFGLPVTSGGVGVLEGR